MAPPKNKKNFDFTPGQWDPLHHLLKMQILPCLNVDEASGESYIAIQIWTLSGIIPPFHFLHLFSSSKDTHCHKTHPCAAQVVHFPPMSWSMLIDIPTEKQIHMNVGWWVFMEPDAIWQFQILMYYFCRFSNWRKYSTEVSRHILLLTEMMHKRHPPSLLSDGVFFLVFHGKFRDSRVPLKF